MPALVPIGTIQGWKRLADAMYEAVEQHRAAIDDDDEEEVEAEVDQNDNNGRKRQDENEPNVDEHDEAEEEEEEDEEEEEQMIIHRATIEEIGIVAKNLTLNLSGQTFVLKDDAVAYPEMFITYLPIGEEKKQETLELKDVEQENVLQDIEKKFAFFQSTAVGAVWDKYAKTFNSISFGEITYEDLFSCHQGFNISDNGVRLHLCPRSSLEFTTASGQTIKQELHLTFIMTTNDDDQPTMRLYIGPFRIQCDEGTKVDVKFDLVSDLVLEP
jgi:hypothetical protein